MTRFAVFYAFVPPNEQLPEDRTRIAERICHLRAIQLESEPLDSAAASSLSESVGARLEMGESIKAHEHSMVAWANGRMWSTPRGTVVIAAVPTQPTSTSPLAPKGSPVERLVSPRKMVMIAYAPGGTFQSPTFSVGFHDAALQQKGESKNRDLRDADSAIVWAGLPSVASDLNVMLEVIRSSERRSAKADSALVRAFRAIRDTANSLVPRRRAAALLAADLVRYAVDPYPQLSSGPEDRTLFSELHKIIHGPAAEFSQYPDVFNRAWLWEAYRLDSLGPAGHLAFVRLLQRGFRQDAECAEDVAFYAGMIERGEAYLLRGNTDPLIRFYVGAAHKSIFDLAHKTPGDYVEQPPTKSEAEAARLRGIDHFRAAVTGLQDRSMRREAWYYATRLLLRKPGNPWLFCAYD